MNNRNPAEGLRMVLSFIRPLWAGFTLAFTAVCALIGSITLALVGFALIVVTTIIFFILDNGDWEKAKKKEDDWMSKREDYLK